MSESQIQEMDSDRRFVWLIAFAFTLLAFLPYLYGAIIAGDQHYLWLTFNAQDNCVYLAWAKQAQEGHLTFSNRFTTEAQQGITINLFFWLIGALARLTDLPPLFWLHAVRLACALGFVFVIYALLRQLGFDALKARLALICVLFSAGFGWLWQGWYRAIRLHSPVDMWQPEAITFLSFYLNPIFAASLLIMASAFYYLLRIESEQRARPALKAGILLLIIGNIHSYDYLHIAAAWGLYQSSKIIANKKIDWRNIGFSAMAFLIGVPSVAYQYYLYKTETVFRLRADVPTLSPPFLYYALGYGLLFFGTIALLGWKLATKQKKAPSLLSSHSSTLFLIAWAAAGFMVAYLPVAFQRKMLMGTHIPLSILFAVLLIEVGERYFKPKALIAFAGIIIAFTTLSNIRWIVRDMSSLKEGTHSITPTKENRPFLTQSEWKIIQWIVRNLPKDAAIFAPPSLSLYIPPFTGRKVYCGHWGETPFYPAKREEVYRFFDKNTSDAERIEIISAARVNYLIAYRSPDSAPVQWRQYQLEDFTKTGFTFLKERYANQELIVYQITLSKKPSN